MDTFHFTPRLASRLHVRIVEGDLYTCEGLSTLFRIEGFQTTFTADWDMAFHCSSRPDAFLINLELATGSGISLLRRAKLELPGVPIVMLTDKSDVDSVVQAMKFGAIDVIPKPIDTEHLLFTVREALKRNVQMGAMRNGARSVEVRGFQQLTPKEREILQLVMDGHTSKSAGHLLDRSPRTVEVHRLRVMKKLGARNTADLIKIVLTS